MGARAKIKQKSREGLIDTHVFLPPSLHLALKSSAKRERRSFTAEFIVWLEAQARAKGLLK